VHWRRRERRGRGSRRHRQAERARCIWWR
jgi:hypothetical protein